MKKLFFVVPSENKIEELLLIDMLKKYKALKSVIFYPSPDVLEKTNFIVPPWQAKCFAEKMARELNLPTFSLRENLSEEDIQRGSAVNVWKFLRESSESYVENIFLVLPIDILLVLQKGGLYFYKTIKNIEQLSKLSQGSISFVDFGYPYYRTEDFFIQTLEDKRVWYLESLPSLFLPTGHSSPTKKGEDVRVILDQLILRWLNAKSKNNSWSRKSCKQILNKVKRIFPYLSYPKKIVDQKKVA